MKKILLEIEYYILNTKFGHLIGATILMTIFSAVLTLLGLSFWPSFIGGMIVSLILAIRDCNQRWF